MVCGQPGLVVVVGITRRRCGGRARCGGCGMEKEAMSQFVTCLTLDQRFERAHARNHAHAQIVVYINCIVL